MEIIPNIREIGQNVPSIDECDKERLLIHSICSGGNYAAILEFEPERIHEVDEKGYSALHWAAYFDNLAAAELLITNCPSIIHKQSCRGYTPLHLACQQNSLAVIKLILLSTSSTLSTINQWQESALHLAAQNGHMSVTRVIIECSEETVLATLFQSQDQWGRTPAAAAKESGHLVLATFLTNLAASNHQTSVPSNVLSLTLSDTATEHDIAISGTASRLPQGFLQALKKKCVKSSSDDIIDEDS